MIPFPDFGLTYRISIQRLVQLIKSGPSLSEALSEYDALSYRFSPSGHEVKVAETEEEEEVLETIDSTADMWGKKKGVGIVDVFASGETGSSPVMSEDEDIDSVTGSDG